MPLTYDWPGPAATWGTAPATGSTANWVSQTRRRRSTRACRSASTTICVRGHRRRRPRDQSPRTHVRQHRRRTAVDADQPIDTDTRRLAPAPRRTASTAMSRLRDRARHHAARAARRDHDRDDRLARGLRAGRVRRCAAPARSAPASTRRSAAASAMDTSRASCARRSASQATGAGDDRRPRSIDAATPTSVTFFSRPQRREQPTGNADAGSPELRSISLESGKLIERRWRRRRHRHRGKPTYGYTYPATPTPTRVLTDDVRGTSHDRRTPAAVFQLLHVRHAAPTPATPPSWTRRPPRR